jgi:hypothetical protein
MAFAPMLEEEIFSLSMGWVWWGYRLFVFSLAYLQSHRHRREEGGEYTGLFFVFGFFFFFFFL